MIKTTLMRVKDRVGLIGLSQGETCHEHLVSRRDRDMDDGYALVSHAPSDVWKRSAGFVLKYENGRFSGSGITTIGSRFDPFGPKN